MKRHRLGLMIFRRDFRLYDNTAWNRASELYAKILPLFIFDPRQVTD